MAIPQLAHDFLMFVCGAILGYILNKRLMRKELLETEHAQYKGLIYAEKLAMFRELFEALTIFMKEIPTSLTQIKKEKEREVLYDIKEKANKIYEVFLKYPFADEKLLDLVVKNLTPIFKIESIEEIKKFPAPRLFLRIRQCVMETLGTEEYSEEIQKRILNFQKKILLTKDLKIK